MTITLYLQKETLLRDLQTLQVIFQYTIEVVEKLRTHYEPLNISIVKLNLNYDVSIQVSTEEFALIGAFNEKVLALLPHKS